MQEQLTGRLGIALRQDAYTVREPAISCTSEGNIHSIRQSRIDPVLRVYLCNFLVSLFRILCFFAICILVILLWQLKS